MVEVVEEEDLPLIQAKVKLIMEDQQVLVVAVLAFPQVLVDQQELVDMVVHLIHKDKLVKMELKMRVVMQDLLLHLMVIKLQVVLVLVQITVVTLVVVLKLEMVVMEEI